MDAQRVTIRCGDTVVFDRECESFECDETAQGEFTAQGTFAPVLMEPTDGWASDSHILTDLLQTVRSL